MASIIQAILPSKDEPAEGDSPAAQKVYIDEDTGSDEANVKGDESLPFKSLQYAYIQTDGTGNYLTRKSQTGEIPEGADESSRLEWKPATKSALKKAATMLQNHKKKQSKEADIAIREKKEEEARQVALEEAKKIVIKDPGTPAFKIQLDSTTYTDEHGKQMSVALKSGTGAGVGTRVKVLGRAQQIRKQKANMFVELRDGYGKMQVVFTGDLAKTYDAVTLTRETSMEIYGEMWEVPAGAKAPMNRELHVDYFVVRPEWKAAGGDDAITSRIAPGAEHSLLLDLRHLTLRGDTASSIMLVRDAVEGAFHTVFREMRMRKVSPPALVQTQVEGGATLFKFDYYGEEAFLTQSSQLYLETCLASLGNVYCIEKSFRAEKSLTRRHLSEYTHVEGELDFITFDDLLAHLEELMCRVLDNVFADAPIAAALKELNPNFMMPQRPFLRMKYSDAIDWLNEHNIPNEEGQPHIFGDDIAEAAERRMTDIINKPIFLTHFPVEIKAFYMQKDPSDKRVTESVDCLMPGVGEIIGGSMRMDNYEELYAAYKREGIPHEPYYWYTDQRKYGSSPHGGYGLGLERFLAWLCGLHTVRDACLYPRFMGRCKP